MKYPNSKRDVIEFGRTYFFPLMLLATVIGSLVVGYFVIYQGHVYQHATIYDVRYALPIDDDLNATHYKVTVYDPEIAAAPDNADYMLLKFDGFTRLISDELILVFKVSRSNLEHTLIAEVELYTDVGTVYQLKAEHTYYIDVLDGANR